MIDPQIYAPVDSGVTIEDVQRVLEEEFSLMCDRVRSRMQISCTNAGLAVWLWKSILESENRGIRVCDENGEPT